MLRIISIYLLLISSPALQASNLDYNLETLNWDFQRDWATYDQELKTFYRFLPMTEKSHDQFRRLDRRFDYECLVKERNLRGFFAPGSLVIGVYDLKECKKTIKNPNWLSPQE